MLTERASDVQGWDAPTGGRDGWWSHRRRAMGTEVHVVGHGVRVASLVDARLEQCESAWSRFRPDSDLSALNRSPRTCVAVSALLELALRRAVAAWSATGGRFDPTVLDAVESAGYDRDFPAMDDRPRDRGPGRRCPGAGEVHVGRGHVVRPCGVRFDLGGIGKGLAADLVAADLLDAGVGSVCVSVGGDVRVGGAAPAGGWCVPVADAYSASARRTVTIPDGGVATSSTGVRRWPASDGGWIHHLVDPGTGRPAETDVVAVTVVAADTWWAECLAKSALVAGSVAGAELLTAAGVSGWICTDAGTVAGVGGLRGVSGDPDPALPPGRDAPRDPHHP